MERYIAGDDIQWRHPKDHPPPHGTKLLIYMYPYGTTIIGQWQHSGGALWSPLPKVSTELKKRLENT